MCTPFCRSKSDCEGIKNKGNYFDEKIVKKWEDWFCKNIKIVKGEGKGKPFNFLPWQKECFSQLVGWRTKEGKRLKRNCYISVPKKNGKTPFASIISLFFLFGRKNVNVAFTANTKDQSRIAYDETITFIKNNKSMYKATKICESRYNLSIKQLNNKAFCLSSEIRGNDGLQLSLCIFDELHQQLNDKLFNILKYSTVADKEALKMIITTAGGVKDETNLCYKQYCISKKWMSGEIIDDTYYSFITEYDDNLVFDNEEKWRIANPALDYIFSIDDLRNDYNLAKQNSIDQTNFRRLRLNQWVEQVSSQWLNYEKWEKCIYDGDLSKYESNLIGQKCFGGLDLSHSRDFSAYVLLFPPKWSGEAWHFIPYFFSPNKSKNIMREKYEDNIILSEGEWLDQELIFDKIKEINNIYKPEKLCVDPYNGTHLMSKLSKEGYEIINVQQTFRNLSSPTKFFEELIQTNKIKHNNNSLFNEMVRTCQVKFDNHGNSIPFKGKNDNVKIDGIAALVTCLAEAERDVDVKFDYSNSIFNNKSLL